MHFVHQESHSPSSLRHRYLRQVALDRAQATKGKNEEENALSGEISENKEIITEKE